jgi:murein DD-endopeptidase MepM/ murein hydrolase activator NlpD
MTAWPYIVGLLVLASLRGSAMVWPVEGVVTSTFRSESRPSHDGIDVAAPLGTPVVAPLGGIVSGAYWSDRGGNSVLLEMDNGKRAGFAHLIALDVSPGDRLERGEQLGRVGVTGNTTGPHLHFTLHDGNDYVDPLNYLPALT